MKRISVFCGASSGTDKVFEMSARLLGQKLAQENIELVYGGAKIGLMGAIADGVISIKGKGVIQKSPSSIRLRQSSIFTPSVRTKSVNWPSV